MLPLACAIALITGPAHRSVEFVIPVRYTRPSRIASLLQGAKDQSPLLSRAMLSPDDMAWTLTVRGSADQVLDARSFVRLIDVPHPVIKLKLHVDAPAERFDYDISASVQSGQKWKLSEEATGATIALEPRLGQDGTCTICCRIAAEGSEVETTLRMRKGELQKVSLGNRIVREVSVGDVPTRERVRTVPLPTLSISYQVETPKPYPHAK